MKKTNDGSEAAGKLDKANKIRLGSFYRSALALLAALVAALSEANITVNGESFSMGVNLGIADGTFTVSGTGNDNNRLVVTKNCTIILDNVTLAPTAYTTTGSWSKKYYGYPAIFVTNGVSAVIKLKGTNKITPSYTKGNQTGIYVGTGAAISITNLTDGASLNIDASSHSGNVAIGGWIYENASGGAVTLYGGTITAKSGENCAGIGGGDGGAGGTVNIYGGSVTANGGAGSSNAGAGIGGGNSGSGGTVNIYGGTVKATGASYSTTYASAGIGGGHKGAGGTVNIYGGTVTATGGTRSAGIGGGHSAAGGTVKVYGGKVTATGGERGAGIGGGTGAAAGAFYNYGGTVWATGNGTATTYGDIGCGQAGSGAMTYQLCGGSTILANGLYNGMSAPVDASGNKVYALSVTDLTANKQYTFDGLPASYGQTTLIANSSGIVRLYLPNGSYEFSDDDYTYTATISGAAKTATRTEKTREFTVSFVSDDETVASFTGEAGTAYDIPAAPAKTGYTFASWSPMPDGNIPEANTTYTATYTVNQHTITFDADGGSEVADMEFAYGAAVAGVPEPVKEGWEFAGWSPALPEKMPDEDMSVKATWILAPYFRVDSVVAKRPYGDVEITYSSYRKTLEGDFNFVVSAGGLVVTAKTFKASLDLSEGTHTAVWDAKADLGEKLRATRFSYALTVGSKAEAKYLVLDLADGSKTYLADAPEGGWTDEHKTAKLVLRKIIGGGETATFAMGSPNGEHGREKNETLHDVTLTKPYWMGVFEFTEGQYATVAGGGDATSAKPKTGLSWTDVKGAIQGAGVDTALGSSFLGKLRAKASDLGLNLPTEAEWEYACRAGTATAFSNGTALKNSSGNANSVPDGFSDIAVWSGNAGGAAAAVGTKAPNAWGLYDMHGNAAELVHDASDSTPADYGGDAATDPEGLTTSSAYHYRVYRDGSYAGAVAGLRSAARAAQSQTATSDEVGFRVAARGFAGEATAGAEENATGAGAVVIGKGGVMVVFR